MTIIVCLDDKNGLSFNNRRQSRDKILIEDIIQTYNKTFNHEYLPQHNRPKKYFIRHNFTPPHFLSSIFFIFSLQTFL